jgi:hypothetical protein
MGTIRYPALLAGPESEKGLNSTRPSIEAVIDENV